MTKIKIIKKLKMAQKKMSLKIHLLTKTNEDKRVT